MVLMTGSKTELLVDFEAARSEERWRDKVGWPVPYHVSRMRMFGLVDGFNDFICELSDEDERNIVILASTAVFPKLAWLVHTAVAVEAEAQTSSVLIGGVRELNILRGQSPQNRPEPIASGSEFVVPSMAWLRRLKITKSWNTAGRMPGALVASQATILSTNELVVNTARKSQMRIDFRFGEQILTDARRQSLPAEPRVDVNRLAADLAQRISISALSNEDIRKRLEVLLFNAMENVFIDSARDLEALKHYRKLPDEIWSGTGAKYLVRALGLEVLRRGGRVLRFGHGGSAGMSDYDGLFALADLAATSHYVAESPNIAKLLVKTDAAKPVEKYRQLEIVAPTEPSGFDYIRNLKPRNRPERPKVIYVQTATRGRFLQGAPPQQPDVIYVDWQIRFAQMLNSLPINLLCKPHPHGMFHGIRHPVEDVATTTYRRFEEVMEEGDVFVFDAIQSTAFWEALCTDKPVIAVGFGQSGFAPGVADMMADRCRILTVEYDERNCPQIDLDELSELILGQPYTYDPEPIINLMMGR